MVFLSLVTLPFDLDLQTHRVRDQTLLPAEFGANLFSGSQDIPYTSKKLEAKDVLPNISRMQATERAEKCHFCAW